MTLAAAAAQVASRTRRRQDAKPRLVLLEHPAQHFEGTGDFHREISSRPCSCTDRWNESAVAAFVLVQRIAGLEFRSWLRLSGEPPQAADGSDDGSGDGSSATSPIDALLGLPAPVAGVAFALFAVPVATVNAAGVNVLPVYGTGFPSGLRALVTLFIAPLSEEIFFRAWLLSAFARAGGEANLALIASAGLYGLYVVPISSVLAGTTGGDGPALLLLYEALGALLAYLFQRSGGSLSLVVVTHCTFNLALALLATQVGRAAVLVDADFIL